MNDSTSTPSPMSEEGTTVPQDSPIADQFSSDDEVVVTEDVIVFDDPVEDDTAVATEPDATFGEPEPDPAASDAEPAAAAPLDDRPTSTPEEITTEEYAVVDDTPVDDAGMPQGAAVPADDGSSMEDADVETAVDGAARDDGGSSVAAVAATSVADDTPATTEEHQDAPAPAGDDDAFLIGHVFDQTNGVIEGIEGDSDGTAVGDEESSADRHGMNEPNPVGQQDAWKDDHYGADAGRDPNP